MKKINSNQFTLYGINSTICVLDCNSFEISSIDILKDGRAEKNNLLMKKISRQSIVPTFYKKQSFYNKYPDIRSQGIVISFYGHLITKEIPDFDDLSDVCLLVLDQIEDPQNFGQIIRTAECAGINGIIFPKHHSVSISNSVLQVSQGAFVNVPLYEVTNLKNEFSRLKDNGFWVIGIENSIKSETWDKIDYTDKTIIVVGSEGRGIREKVLDACDYKATIPMQGMTNSLNVSATVSAIVFERLRQIQNNN